MIRLNRMRHIAEKAAADALNDHLGLGYPHAKFSLHAVNQIATWAALSALRDYITANALADVGEIVEMISPRGAAERDALMRKLVR